MATLKNTKIKDRYKSLLKLTGTANDVLAADASAKVVEDGDGNDSALALSTTRVGIGTTTPGADLEIANKKIEDDNAQIGFQEHRKPGNILGGKYLVNGVSELTVILFLRRSL